MIDALSMGLQNRLTHLASLVAGCEDGSDGGEDAEKLVRAALQAELDRLVQVPFGVPLLHEIG